MQLGSAYGFSVENDRSNVVHILQAMVPHQFTYDEGFIPVKLAAMNAAREAGEFAARLGKEAGRIGFDRAVKQMSREAPQLVKLINYVAEKLGLRMSQKVFGVLVPLVGGAVNGSLNVAFQQAGHSTGMDYFRAVLLAGKYGEDRVRNAVQGEVKRLRAARDESR